MATNVTSIMQQETDIDNNMTFHSVIDTLHTFRRREVLTGNEQYSIT